MTQAAIEAYLQVEPIPEGTITRRARKREFYRKLSDLLEEFADVAETEGNLTLDGGQWELKGGIRKGGE